MYINTLWPSDAIWWDKTSSALVKVMVWCLRAPSHYLNQCWLTINEVLWYSPEGNSRVMLKISLIRICCKITCLKLPPYHFENNDLKHWGRDKMATTFANTFKYKFVNGIGLISLKISLKFVPKGPVNNIPAVAEIMAWCRSCAKPLSEPIMAQFTDKDMHHLASMS